MSAYRDTVFAPIDVDHGLDRVAGGNETEVYRSDDGRHVVKLKGDLGGDMADALVEARRMRAEAERFAACLGPRHSVSSDYLLARDSRGRVQVLVVQPYLRHARPLAATDWRRLSAAERRRLAGELRDIIRRSAGLYARCGAMPDLYGRTSASPQERWRGRSARALPRRVWSFLIERTLLHSHNLLLTDEPRRRIVLIDYDYVRRGPLYRAVYFLTRLALFVRDLAAIRLRLG